MIHWFGICRRSLKQVKLQADSRCWVMNFVGPEWRNLILKQKKKEKPLRRLQRCDHLWLRSRNQDVMFAKRKPNAACVERTWRSDWARMLRAGSRRVLEEGGGWGGSGTFAGKLLCLHLAETWSLWESVKLLFLLFMIIPPPVSDCERRNGCELSEGTEESCHNSFWGKRNALRLLRVLNSHPEFGNGNDTKTTNDREP